MEVANRMGYKYNTFTHILEGYKVADKMKAHGANASTFSDWWAYKMEVAGCYSLQCCYHATCRIECCYQF